jgi:hypothetical protein
MNGPIPIEESAVQTVIEEQDAAKIFADKRARENHINTHTWWTDGSRSDIARVGAAV